MPKAAERKIDPDKVLIGWREWLALPGLNIPALKAKIDTGARTSALHAVNIEEYMDQGRRMVRFGVHPLQDRRDVKVFCSAQVLERRRVKDSGGHVEKRYLIQTTVRLCKVERNIKITLTNRSGMAFRMLLGRTFLEEGFIIDPARSYLCGRSSGRAAYGAPALEKSRKQSARNSE